MAEIPNHAPILIKVYQIHLYIKEVLITWDSRFCNSLPTYIKDISYNVKEFKHLSKDFLYLNYFYVRGIFPIR